MNVHQNVFYLKVNRNEGYTIRNLWQWITIADGYINDAIWYVLCDNDVLKDRILKEFVVKYPDIAEHFIKSIIDDESTFIVSNTTDERWRMAGYAHLTTFIHARDNHYSSFWNIDADDTRFCLNIERSRELLKNVEEYADQNKIDIFSLDMHTTRIGSGRHWSFGVSYTKNRKDWIAIMEKNCTEDHSIEDKWCNFDRFFRYIRNHSDNIKLESFYAENLKFFHYSNDFFWRLCESALYHWKNRHLIFPILHYAVGLKNEKSCIPIDPIVVRLDIGISDEESMISILQACNSPSLYLNTLKNR